MDLGLLVQRINAALQGDGGNLSAVFHIQFFAHVAYVI
jgi:hypothetical protein